MEKTKQERKEYIKAIESGCYKTGGTASTKVIVVIAIVLGLIFGVNIILNLLQSDGALLFLTSVMLLIWLFPIVLVIMLVNLKNGAALDKITSLQRDLILNGEIIEANLDAIEQKGNLFIFRCSANYAGDTWHFSSPAIRVQPIPSEDRKIPVYINPQNPNQFFVDIYSRLPLAGDNVLHDRSDLRIDTSKKNQNNNAAKVLLLIICMTVLIPLAILCVFWGVIWIGSGVPSLGVMMVIPLFMVGFIIYFICKTNKRTKSLLEKGYYIPATALKFWVTTNKDSKTYHLSARYIEPSTKIVHEFQTSGPETMRNLVDAKVNVYINPDNTKEYYMDTHDALKRLGFTTSGEANY